MKKSYILFFLFFLLFLMILTTYNFPKNREDIGRSFLQNKGYEIIKYEGTIDQYTLSKDNLTNTEYYILWSVQNDTPFEHINDEIYIEKYVTKNHPLDTWSSGIFVSSGNTEVRLFIIDNKVIGGISIPILKNGDISQLTGPIYSIDGKTFKEIKDISYEEWENWFLESLNKI